MYPRSSSYQTWLTLKGYAICLAWAGLTALGATWLHDWGGLFGPAYAQGMARAQWLSMGYALLVV